MQVYKVHQVLKNSRYTIPFINIFIKGIIRPSTPESRNNTLQMKFHLHNQLHNQNMQQILKFSQKNYAYVMRNIFLQFTVQLTQFSQNNFLTIQNKIIKY